MSVQVPDADEAAQIVNMFIRNPAVSHVFPHISCLLILVNIVWVLMLVFAASCFPASVCSPLVVPHGVQPLPKTPQASLRSVPIPSVHS